MSDAIVSELEWDDGAGDATDRGWWFRLYALDGISERAPVMHGRRAGLVGLLHLVVSGTLDESSDRDEVLTTIARQLGVDRVEVE